MQVILILYYVWLFYINLYDSVCCAFLSIFLVSMIEWCYQWDDPEYVTKYYESLRRASAQTEKTSWDLAENLWQQLQRVEVKKDKDKDYRKKSDAKDALYYINL